MKKQLKLTTEKKLKLKALLVSFSIPFSIVILSYIVRGVAPFGEGTICSMDGFSQYFPMLQNMDTALENGEPFYSFSGALGFNLWTQSAYYTNSPLWLFVYILPKSMQLCAINLLVAFKIGLTSLFFCTYLFSKKASARKSHLKYLCPAFSCAWALSAYVMAYINQLMWLDVIMLLPLVIMGLEKLIEQKKSTLYTVTLFVSIWSCFYLAYMVCIFVCLYFFYFSFSHKKKFAQIAESGLRFVFSSLLAAGMCAVVLIPVYKALKLTIASELSFTSLGITNTPLEILRQFLPFCDISLEYGAPNLYCTTLAFVLMLFCFFQKKIDIRERLCSAFFVIIMTLSMCLNLGDYLWHGFHFPNQLPSRQSFLLIFLVLIFAYKGVVSTGFKVKSKQMISIIIIFACCFNGFVILINQTWISKASSLQRFDTIIEEFPKSDDNDFVRLEFSDEKKNNGPQQYSFNGVSYYSSLMSEDAYRFFESLGFERYAKNVSVYYKSSDILDSIFGIKYLIQPDRKTVRENKTALPVAFLSDSAIVDYHPSDYDNKDRCHQNFWLSLTGKNEINLIEDYEQLKKGGLQIIRFDTDLIEGSINCSQDGILFTTIPYDEGWQFFVDGKQVEITKCADYLSCCKITKGTHEIIFKYTVPGIKTGSAISVLCLGIFTVLTANELGLIKIKKEENI